MRLSVRRFLLLLVLLVATLSNAQEDVELDTTHSIENAEESMLIRAAAIGDVQTLQHELSMGHNVDDANGAGWTPVLFAVQYGHYEALETLVRGGANLNWQENDGWSALMMAAASGNGDMIRLLLAANAHPLLFNNQGYAAHTIAFFNEHVNQARIIVEAALERSIMSGDTPGIWLTVSDGAPVNTQTEQGATALIAATNAGDVDLVAKLLATEGINVDLAEKDGWTALMFASVGNHAQIVQMLLDFGCNMDAVSVQGFTALSIARDFEKMDALAALQARYAALEAVRAEAAAARAASEAAAMQQKEEEDRAHHLQQQLQQQKASQSKRAEEEAAPAKAKSAWRLW